MLLEARRLGIGRELHAWLGQVSPLVWLDGNAAPAAESHDQETKRQEERTKQTNETHASALCMSRAKPLRRSQRLHSTRRPFSKHWNGSLTCVGACVGAEDAFADAVAFGFSTVREVEVAEGLALGSEATEGTPVGVADTSGGVSAVAVAVAGGGTAAVTSPVFASPVVAT